MLIYNINYSFSILVCLFVCVTFIYNKMILFFFFSTNDNFEFDGRSSF